MRQIRAERPTSAPKAEAVNRSAARGVKSGSAQRSAKGIGAWRVGLQIRFVCFFNVNFVCFSVSWSCLFLFFKVLFDFFSILFDVFILFDFFYFV